MKQKGLLASIPCAKAANSAVGGISLAIGAEISKQSKAKGSSIGVGCRGARRRLMDGREHGASELVEGNDNAALLLVKGSAVAEDGAPRKRALLWATISLAIHEATTSRSVVEMSDEVTALSASSSESSESSESSAPWLPPSSVSPDIRSMVPDPDTGDGSSM